ncbi:thioester domain-containing protein [Streptomyces sp. XM4193]|uniref:thioester domain-containing protein n=1 Tax=Streptomyces sp. XM4193 TaxID=2929782 RepID=UPI001FF78439|nr:thioester domain-containing protein [Streptomyces sp. XM4193]MCK1798645.1 thioester domain-containing protein [Streptomyces sp. XM4193]
MAFALTATAPGASAEELTPEDSGGGAVATLDGLAVHGKAIIHEEGERIPTGAGLFEMAVAGGGSLQTYSVDMLGTTQEQAQYQESSWRASSLHDNPDAGKIRWILKNSYPQVNDLSVLARKAGAGKLTPQAAAAGTQVAIWRYSEHTEVTAVDKSAQKLAAYLYKEARKEAEPGSSLALSPSSVAGRPGDRIGPITVRTAAQSATVSTAPDAGEGVRITDRKGETVTSVSHGDKVYLEIPADAEDGATALTIEAATTVPVGRVFTSQGSETTSQTQILAGSSEATAAATVNAVWAAEGAIPAITARKDCGGGAVNVTVDNSRGDAPFEFTLGKEKHRVAAGAADRVAVPVKEDQAYRIGIAAPQGRSETFSGVLDCAPKSEVPAETPGLSVQTEPVTVGGSDSEPNLAETGNTSNVPLLIGIAAGMLVLGAVAILMVRRTKAESDDLAADDTGSDADADDDTSEDASAARTDDASRAGVAGDAAPTADGREDADSDAGDEPAPKSRGGDGDKDSEPGR